MTLHENDPGKVDYDTAFRGSLLRFVAGVQARKEADYAANFGNLTAPIYKLTFGPRYAKVVEDRGIGGRSVFCFVRIADGAILKAEGWSKPAKHARGSIFVNEGRDAVSLYGAHYLR